MIGILLIIIGVMIHSIQGSMVTAVDLATAGAMVGVAMVTDGVDMAGVGLVMAVGAATAGEEDMDMEDMEATVGPAEAMATEVVMVTEIGAVLMV